MTDTELLHALTAYLTDCLANVEELIATYTGRYKDSVLPCLNASRDAYATILDALDDPFFLAERSAPNAVALAEIILKEAARP